MRQLGFLLLTSLVAVTGSALAIVTPGALAAGDTAYVIDEEVNLRAEPSTSAAVLDLLRWGQLVTIRGEQIDEFVPVTVNDVDGWIAAEFIGAEMPAPATTGIDPLIGVDEPWIDVNRSLEQVTLYVGNVPQAIFPARLGKDPSADGYYATAVGTYHVFALVKGLTVSPFAEDTYMTDWVGFDPDRLNGFHSPVRSADGSVKAFQNVTTMGCVRLGEDAAIAVFDFAFVGMRVVVHD